MICAWRPWVGVDTKSHSESSKLPLQVVSKHGALCIRDMMKMRERGSVASCGIRCRSGSGFFLVPQGVREGGVAGSRGMGQDARGVVHGKLSHGVALLPLPSEKGTKRPRLPPVPEIAALGRELTLNMV